MARRMSRLCCAGSEAIDHPHGAADAHGAFGVQQECCPGLASGLIGSLDGFENATGIEGAQFNLWALLLEQICLGELGLAAGQGCILERLIHQHIEVVALTGQNSFWGQHAHG